MDARLRTPDYELRGQASSMTEKTIVRSQLLVNFNINIVIMGKVTNRQALKLFMQLEGKYFGPHLPQNVLDSNESRLILYPHFDHPAFNLFYLIPYPCGAFKFQLLCSLFHLGLELF